MVSSCLFRATRQRVQCDCSEKSYSQKSKLNFHKANTHGGGADCPTSCNFCTKRFSTKNAKEEHEASVHTSEKRLPCHLSDQRFT